MLHSRKLFIGAIALLSSCTSSDAPRPDRGMAEEADSMLVPAMSVRVSGDSVHLEMRLSNGGVAPVTLSFSSSQRYDFAVLTESGDTVWLWSAAQMFAQVLGTETIEASAQVTYGEAWDAEGRRGVFRAIGRVVSTDRPVELETEFEVVAR